MPLGTLWFFSSLRKDFTEQETNLMEIIAGRIAAELEREILLGENERYRSQARHEPSTIRITEDATFRINPIIGGWDLAAFTSSAEPIGELCDWFVHADGNFSVSLGLANNEDLSETLALARASGALRASQEDEQAPGLLLDRINNVIQWGSSSVDSISLLNANFEVGTGEFQLALGGGRIDAYVLRPSGHEAIQATDISLGLEPDVEFNVISRRLSPGDVLLLCGNHVDRSARWKRW